MDIPQPILAHIVSLLPYRSLPPFRASCRLARELVDAASEGWVLKVDEGEALLTSSLLQKLTSLNYIFFECWTFDASQEASFLAVILANWQVFNKLKEVRFPGCDIITFACLRGLLSAVSMVNTLHLPTLPKTMCTESLQYKMTFNCLSGLTTLSDLALERWPLSDSAAVALGQLKQLRKLLAGDTSQLSVHGYEALACLTGLTSLWVVEVTGSNTRLEPLTALSNLKLLRAELSKNYHDNDLGPLSMLPAIETLGWWHQDLLTPSNLRWWCLGANLRDLSVYCDMDLGMLANLALSCWGMQSLQVHRVLIPPTREAPGALPCLPKLTTLVVNDLHWPPPEQPEPCCALASLFPALANVMAFGASGRGLQQLRGATGLQRLLLHAQAVRDEVLEFLPRLPSLVGLQLECCRGLTDSCVGAFRAVPGVRTLLLIGCEGVSDAFLEELPGVLPGLGHLVLSGLEHVGDEGLMRLGGLGSLERLELLKLPNITQAGVRSVVWSLSKLSLLVMVECPKAGDKAALMELAAEAPPGPCAREGDLEVEWEQRLLQLPTLADEFGVCGAS